MKFLSKRIACLLLAAVMAVGVLPASAFRAQEELPATPAEEEITSAGMAELPAEPLDAAEPAQLAAEGDLTIPGYTRVTAMPTDGLLGKYLIVAPYNGNYYMLYPGGTGAGATGNNAAKLVVGDNGAATGYIPRGAVAVASAYSGSETTDFSAAENTIVKSEERYSVTAGTNYRLCLLSGNPGYQTSGDSSLQITVSNGLFRFIKPENSNAKLMFYSPRMNFDQSGNDSDGIPDLMLFQRSPVIIPGYDQVTSVSQIAGIEDKSKLLVVAEGENGLYAMYPHLSNGRGAGDLPATGMYGLRCAKLEISGDTVTAKAVAGNDANRDLADSATLTAVDMANLHLTIADGAAGKYTFASTQNGNSVKLNLANNGHFASVAYDMTVEITGGELSIYNSSSSRYLNFAEEGARYAQPDKGTDFWGSSTKTGAPLYLFCQGEVPIQPGSALVSMLSGDQLGGASTTNPNENPTGQNSWVLTGGRAAQGSFTDIAGARTWAGHFEEYVRYTQYRASATDSVNPSFQRHVINTAYEGQTLQNIVDSFDTRIAPLKPRAVVYLVDENGSSEGSFAANLNALITKSLALRDGTGMIVIETLTAADKTAVDNVVNALDEGLLPRVLPVSLTLTTEQKTAEGFPNAQGHLAMAKQLADAVAGRTVSTADRWPYGVSNGNFDANWPVRQSVTANHEGYGTPATLTAPQQAVKTKVDAANTPMTWLFMGDSITHGSAWTGGYDSLAQLFEKFVKDDLGRKQDIVINAGSSGATTDSTITDLDRRLAKYDPDVVVLMLGTNDNPGNDEADTTYKNNLRTLLNKIMEKGAVPIVRTPPTSNQRNMTRVAGLIQAVVAEDAYANSVIFVDQYTVWAKSNWQAVYTDNGLHPDEAGHLWFAHQLINEMGLWDADSAICNLEYLAREATVSADELTIDGYTKVTQLPDDGLELGYYLFVAPCNGSFYMLYPGATGAGETGNNAAKLVLNTTTGKATGYIPRGAVAVGSAYGGSAATDFSAADNLVMLDGSYTHESAPSYQVTARGNGYVLFDAANPTQYSAAGAEGAAFFFRNNDGTFVIRNNGNNHAALHLYTNHMNFNQSGGTPANSSFLLFKSDALPPVPLAELEAMIATAESKNGRDYTAASWAALTAPLAAAKAVAEDSTQNTQYLPVANALKALRAAVNGLQEKPRYSEVPSTATKKELDQLRPAPKTGLSQPFPSLDGVIGGAAGNDSYRIPGITTIKGGDHDGRLVAATDIRWRSHLDSSNIDTAVSWSDDGGVTWNTSIVNYFGDSSNTATDNRTAIFIDPLITADNSGNLFLTTNAFPAGTCTHGSRNQPLAQSTGFADITLHNGTQVGQRMAIYTDFHTNVQTDDNYAYYLGEFGADGYADILDAYDGSASGYYADRHFYLYYQKGGTKAPDTDKIYCAQLDNANTWVQQNLFFQNATLHVRTAQFIYMRKSTDGGVTWSDPVILNPQIRTSNESFYGPGPGAGICLADGTLILPMYDNGGGEHATCMYSTDGGNTWTRATRLGFGSESCIVPIDETTLRQFYRDNTTTIHYNDRTLQDGDWIPGSQQSAPGAPKQGNNQLSALRYSKKVNGKDIILVSTATSPGIGGGYTRQGGKIYAFELKSDKTMELVSTYVVNAATDWYGYSSLTELKDGSIGLIFENSQTDGNDPKRLDYCGLTYRTIPMNDIIESEAQSISLTPTEANLYTNAAAGATTIQLTAAVTPAGPGIVWTSSNENVATVSDTGLVTAVGDGTATITATSSSDETASATCTVTVTTKIERILVKQGGTDIGSGPIKVYTNATDEGHSVTLTAETVPANVTYPALNWTRPEGAKGQLTLSGRAENGHSITITAVPGERNVGEVTVEVASAEYPEIKTSFNVHVIRKLESDVSISIRGVNDPTKAPQVGQTLEADIHNLQMTDEGKNALTYQWKRTEDGTTTGIGTGKTYVLTKEDVGAVISVDVTAGVNSFYEDTRSATRSQPVEKEDGPLTGPQGLVGTAPSGADANNGTITGFGADFANYEFRLAVTDGVENDWRDVPGQTISDLAAGRYQVRAKETDTRKAGGFSVVTVPPYGVTTHAIALNAMTNGRVSRSDSAAAENTPVTLTVLPETGFRLAADGLRVEKSDGSAVSVTRVAGRDNEYTFRMPGEAVTVKATFEQLIFTITHELTNLQCSRGAADGHQVAYGASTAITLIPDVGYVLPLRKDITITNSRGITVTGWTINDAGVITITGGVTSDLVIVALGRPDTHTVNYTLTNGLKRVDAPDSVNHLAAYTGVLGAEAGYALPETIVVTVDGSLIGADNYLYNPETGEISISEGKITGNVVITAAGVKADDEIVPVTGVTLNLHRTNLKVGGSVTLIPTIAPDNATNQTVAWATSDENVATVDEDGVVTAVAEGTATITVMTLDGRHTATCELTVTKSTSGGGSTSSGSSTTKTETRDDGSKVTTVTKPDGTVTETVTQPDGTKSETVTTKDGDVTITVTDPNGEELVKAEIPATIPEPETKFEDVDVTPWAEEAIHKMAGLELVNGTGGNKYSPVAPMTRGSLATVLHRLSQGKTDYETTFKDVAQGKYYTEGVAWAAKAKVVTGYSEDIFAPDDVITREQLAVMLCRYAKLIGMDTKADANRLHVFDDGEDTGDWAVDGVAWCVAKGILKGKGQNNLDPTANVTRAEVAVMLDRFIDLIK